MIQTFKMSRSDAAVAGVEARTLQIMESPYYRSGEIKFTWTIKDFLKRPERKGQSFASPRFTIDVADVGKTTWKLDLAPKGNDKRENGDWISIFLVSQKNLQRRQPALETKSINILFSGYFLFDLRLP